MPAHPPALIVPAGRSAARLVLALALATAGLLLSGCSLVSGGPPPIRYYLVEAIPGSALRERAPLALEVRDLHLPQYLDRFHIVQRIGDGELYIAETQQWGENLRKNLLRVLVSNLSQRLATTDIATPLIPSASRPAVRLVLDIVRFERDVDGKIRLQARWQLTAGLRDSRVALEQASLASAEPLAADDYSASVQAMSAVFAELSDRIAESIATAERAGLVIKAP